MVNPFEVVKVSLQANRDAFAEVQQMKYFFNIGKCLDDKYEL